MLARAILAGLMAFTSAAAVSQGRVPAQSGRFEDRVVAILNAGGTADTMQDRLNRVGASADLTADQRVAVDALRTLVKSRGRPKGLSVAEAEAFAARNPGAPASAVLVAEAALANDDPVRSADTLSAAASRAGSLVQLISPATVSKLTDELEKLSDKKRTAELAKSLLYAGWNRGSPALRSYLALAAIRDEIASERVDRARNLLPAVKSPSSLHLILIDDRLAPLRPDVVRLAGPRLELAWKDFLTRTRDEWLERGDLLSAVAYVEALKQANQYEALSAAFLPRFMRGYNCGTDQVAGSVADDLAESLSRIGRWSKAEDVMRRAGGVSQPVYAAMLLERGDYGRAKALFDRSLRAAGNPNYKEEEKALAWLRTARACASHRSGEAAVLPANLELLDVSARLVGLLCLDRQAEAQAALLSALHDEDERADALRWVQPFSDPPLASDFRKLINRRVRVLQNDPEVRAAAARSGTILDWPLTASVPQPSDLPPAKPASAWQCGDESGWENASPQPDEIRMPQNDP